MADNKNVQLSTLFSNLEDLTVLAKAAAETAAESVIDINAKIDTLAANLATANSKLDDIMVKLDV